MANPVVLICTPKASDYIGNSPNLTGSGASAANISLTGYGNIAVPVGVTLQHNNIYAIKSLGTGADATHPKVLAFDNVVNNGSTTPDQHTGYCVVWQSNSNDFQPVVGTYPANGVIVASTQYTFSYAFLAIVEIPGIPVSPGPLDDSIFAGNGQVVACTDTDGIVKVRGNVPGSANYYPNLGRAVSRGLYNPTNICVDMTSQVILTS